MNPPLNPFAIPRPSTLWRSTAFWAWLAYAILILAAVPHLVVQYWFNQSLGYRSLFWTNLGMQALLFGAYGLLLFLALWAPLRRYARSSTLRTAGWQLGIWIGTLGGWLFARHYPQALLALHGVPFGEVDPVFGRDIGFYVYRLPLWEVVLDAVAIACLLGLAAAMVFRYDQLSGPNRRGEPGSPWRRLTRLASPAAGGFVGLLGLTLTLRTFLGRYGLLLRDNEASGVRTGADYLDLVGVFSSRNLITITALVELGLTVTAVLVLRRWWVAERGREPGSPGLASPDGLRSLRRPAGVAAALLGAELVFYLGNVFQDHVVVSPNEPVVQQEFIQRHIEATLRGYRLDRVEVHEWVPRRIPLSPEELLASKTVQNAPFVSPWVSYLEEPPDIQHFERMAISGSTLVYGPLLQIYTQQQQLRPYYRFLSVDGVRYTVNGERRMYASAVRELPSRALLGPQEWLRYWGSAALQFTHGMGLVMSPANRVDELGNPLYVAQSIPAEPTDTALAHEPRIYFGEGLKDDYVLTNARGLAEFDYATEQFRQEFRRPPGLPDGIRLSSWFRRAMFAFATGDFTAFLFSSYIDPGQTRVHLNRTPLARAAKLAPFLFLDTNIFAFIAGRRVLWMINGLTTTDRYPYSYREVLGDKADERAVEPFPERVINYAEDAVKITVDAYTGETRFYQVADDPLVTTWRRIYPDLFLPAAAMPEPVRAQLAYPLPWFHIQFDDIYKRYHQRDPLEFYNAEDLWDDADETLGSIGRGLSGYGTGDQMTFSYEGYNLLIDPADLPAGVEAGRPGDLQYAMMMPFTPEGARNLRAVIVAFQDPEQYGRLLSLQIPQGTYVPGPEQVDAYIDNDRPVHQQVTMWIRHASEVIRGSTLLLPVRGDLLYLETIWVNSVQNELPQLKLFAVRYHDRITSAQTLEQAILRRAGAAGTAEEERRGGRIAALVRDTTPPKGARAAAVGSHPRDF